MVDKEIGFLMNKAKRHKRQKVLQVQTQVGLTPEVNASLL